MMKVIMMLMYGLNQSGVNVKSKKGQGMVEYGLVLAGVVTVVVAAVAILSGDSGIKKIFTDLIGNVTTAVGQGADGA